MAMEARGSGKRLQPSNSENMSMEPDLEGFDDFTIASSWERFIAGVETACREWMSPPRPALLGEWKDGLHPLQLYFNVTDFLVMSPSNIEGGVDTSEASLLLSTVAVALANCSSQLPAFVPVHESQRKAYQGILGTKSYSARFETDRITSWVPVRFMHLEGLYDLFVSKLAFKTAGDLTVPSVNVEFTMRLTYRTPASKSQNHLETEGLKRVEKNWDADCSWAEWHSLDDPVKGFELVTIWRRRTVTSSLEMAEHENASTLEADKWLLSLTDRLEQKDLEKAETVGFAGRLPSLVLAFQVADEANFLEDFAAADKPYIQHITQSLELPDPVEVDRVLKEVFQEGQAITECGGMDPDYAHGVKGAPPDSLFSRFCLHALQLGGCNIRAIAVIWIEFVREIRLFWDEGHRLPRMAHDAPPDPSTCLLHQKLQLLELCIQQKTSKKTVGDASKAQQKGVSQGGSVVEKVVEVSQELKHLNIDTSVTQNHEETSPNDDSSEENWQDTTDEQLEMDAVFTPQEHVRKSFADRTKSRSRPSSSGTYSQHPIIEERAAISPTQSKLVASDMAAFKAANPGAVLEDFVESRSFQDLLDPPANTSDSRSAEYEDNAETSGRRDMAELTSEPGIWWRQIWDSTGSQSREERKPLFDYTREAEKVMHYLDTIRPQELLAQMLATSYLVVADGLKRSLTDYTVSPSMVEPLTELYASMASLLSNLHKPNHEGEAYDPDILKDLLHLCTLFEKVEANVLLAVSLGKKFRGAPRLLAAFLEEYIDRETREAPQLIVEGITSRQWKDGGATERELVATLFPPLGPTQAWRRSLRMGNFLNGHEPTRREIIFSSCYSLMDLYPDGSRRQRISTQDSYSHRMYLSGTSSDLQVALSVISTD